MDDLAPPTSHERDAAIAALTSWLSSLDENPVVDAVVEDVDNDGDRWFVRVNGEAKDVYSVWFELGQRTLAFESYVMPSPEENHAAFYEQLLRRNDALRGVGFTIGDEGAIFVKGRFDLRHLDARALDQALGSVYAAIEQCFQPALRIGFASRFG